MNPRDKKELMIKLKNMDWFSLGVGFFLTTTAVVGSALSANDTAYFLIIFGMGMYLVYAAKPKN